MRVGSGEIMFRQTMFAVAAGFSVLMLLCTLPSHAETLRLNGSMHWVILAATPDPDTAIGVARSYSGLTQGAQVLQARNGSYTVVTGPVSARTIADAKAQVTRWDSLPVDAYLSSGSEFERKSWSFSSPVLASVNYKAGAATSVRYQDIRVDLSIAPHGDMSMPVVNVWEGDKAAFSFVGSDEYAMPSAVFSANIVWLDKTSSKPQIVITTFTGGAHCCVKTVLIGKTPSNTWQLAKGEDLDGGGYGLEDVDGDGNAELINSDNHFLYAFSSYADSFSPIRISKFVDGRLIDVTDRPAMQHRLIQHANQLEYAAKRTPDLWHSNGFLAGWVASKILVEQGDQAWSRMMTSYTAVSDFGPETCANGGAIEGCPPDLVRKIPFPKALLTLLKELRYTPLPNVTDGLGSAASTPADYNAARMAFEGMPLETRYQFQMLLGVAGYWPAVSNDNFGRRLFEAIQSFQTDNHLPVTGSPTQETQGILAQVASPLLQQWGLKEISHPVAASRLWVPAGIGLSQIPTKSGYSFASSSGIAISFDYYPGSNLTASYDSLLRYAGRYQIVYKVKKSRFFALNFLDNNRNTYARYEAALGGLIGFTISWQADSPLHGERLSTVMSDLFRANVELLQERVPPSALVGATTSASANPPPAPSVEPPPVPQQAISPAPPEGNRADPAESLTGDTGSGFFVTPEGQLVTNEHVVHECKTIAVQFHNVTLPANLIARDPANDLAVLDTHNPGKTAVSMRESARLGEGIAVFGFPLNGILSSGGNFTLGNVTATSGLGDDSRHFQISAPVQPGNSGGPLLDLSGNVVGIVQAKFNAIRMASVTNDIAENINFAIKSEIITSFLKSNGISYSVGDQSNILKPEDLADRAKSFTALVVCLK